MKTLAEIEEGCRRVLGHGECCVKGYLCHSCGQRIKDYTFQSNILTAVSLIRNHEVIWKRTFHRKTTRVRNILDDLCTLIEDEAP